ncbi:MAG: sn-glycerol-3-phosphate ABC transporter ATP-binding protein UgpC [Terracoccus sp.]
MAEVEFSGISRRYAGDVVAIRELNLHVDDGEFLILVGPSGCGKSTALRILAGLDKPTTGQVKIGGKTVTRLGPGERDIAMVFQNYALYPHMSVYRNLSYGLRQRKVAKSDIEERVRETAGILGIEELLDRKPGQLSGGQRQRVAMGRALVRRPQAFLLDEPLSNLDAKLRTQVRGDLKRLHRQLPVTSIYVTHDQVEAMTLGDRICVMSQGEVQQIGTTDEIYNRPENTFVASFMGSPPMNLFRGLVRSGTLVVGGKGIFPVKSPDGPVTVGVRPEDLELCPQEVSDAIVARIDFCEPLGSHVLVHVWVGGGQGAAGEPFPTEETRSGETVVVQAPPGTSLESGTLVGLQARQDKTYLFDVESGKRLLRREKINVS